MFSRLHYLLVFLLFGLCLSLRPGPVQIVQSATKDEPEELQVVGTVTLPDIGPIELLRGSRGSVNTFSTTQPEWTQVGTEGYQRLLVRPLNLMKLIQRPGKVKKPEGLIYIKEELWISNRSTGRRIAQYEMANSVDGSLDIWSGQIIEFKIFDRSGISIREVVNGNYELVLSRETSLVEYGETAGSKEVQKYWRGRIHSMVMWSSQEQAQLLSLGRLLVDIATEEPHFQGTPLDPQDFGY